MKKIYILSALLLMFTPSIFSQNENVNNDWRLTTAGNIRMVVHNRGRIFSWPVGEVPVLVDVEYPPGSGEEHVGSCGISFGGIREDGILGISNGEHMAQGDELWPSTESWDSIWVVNRNDAPLDIGGVNSEGELDIYKPGYKAISDQDLICRYGDYHVLSIGNHNPLYVDIIQTVYTWGTYPLNDVVLYTYEVIPKRFSISDPIFNLLALSKVGFNNNSPSVDDRQVYDNDRKLLILEDGDGSADGDAISNLGFQMFTPADIPESEITWTWLWNTDIWFQPSTDQENYDTFFTTGEVMRSQESFDGSISYLTASFPGFTLEVGDTMKFQIALIMDDDGETEGIITKSELLDILREKDFVVPGPPPPPPLIVEENNRHIKLSWPPTAEVNPETYTDDARLDLDPAPFGGYRVYKSTISRDGPWTLLADYDVLGDGYGPETGLTHEYVDEGLLNNVSYYYAVTSYAKPDTVLNWASTESSIFLSSSTVVPGAESPESVGDVAVVPNPYRADVAYQSYNPPWEQSPSGRSWMPQDRRIQFINLPERCEIKIYTASGDFVAQIDHESSTRGYEDWNLTSYVEQAIASGLYIFTAEDLNTKKVQVGKFVVIM